MQMLTATAAVGIIKVDEYGMAVYQPTYEWKPQLDITTYELALCVSIMVARDALAIEKLPPEARRHWRKIED